MSKLKSYQHNENSQRERDSRRLFKYYPICRSTMLSFCRLGCMLQLGQGMTTLTSPSATHATTSAYMYLSRSDIPKHTRRLPSRIRFQERLHDLHNDIKLSSSLDLRLYNTSLPLQMADTAPQQSSLKQFLAVGAPPSQQQCIAGPSKQTKTPS